MSWWLRDRQRTWPGDCSFPVGPGETRWCQPLLRLGWTKERLPVHINRIVAGRKYLLASIARNKPRHRYLTVLSVGDSSHIVLRGSRKKVAEHRGSFRADCARVGDALKDTQALPQQCVNLHPVLCCEERLH